MNRHDLYLIGLKNHEQRMSDWRDRDITPAWLDKWIFIGSLVIIVCAAVLR